MAELERRVLVKCGGFSTQLAKYVEERIDGDPLWGARLDVKHPDAVLRTHLDFLENGAQIILSNTYQSSVPGFMKYLNLTEEESLCIIRTSVKLAKQARETYLSSLETTATDADDCKPLVFGSIGPYGAYLHDGSEYSGKYAKGLTKSHFQDWHRARIEACLAEGVDGFAIETIPCRLEAEAVVDMVLKNYPGVKFWVSFQCKDAKSLASGEHFADAVLSIWNIVKAQNATDRLYAIGVNCLHPKLVTPLLKSVKDANDAEIPFIVYSNRGEEYDLSTGEWNACSERPLESYAPEWIALGAKIIGGCCRVYPADILRIRKCIDSIYINCN